MIVLRGESSIINLGTITHYAIHFKTLHPFQFVFWEWEEQPPPPKKNWFHISRNFRISWGVKGRWEPSHTFNSDSESELAL